MAEINCVGDLCPIPVIKAKKALESMTAGELVIIVDNEIAAQNLEKLAKEKNCAHNVQKIPGESMFRVSLSKDSTGDQPENIDMDKQRKATESGKVIVAITSDTMGNGDIALGQTLIKGFIYALSESDKMPDTIIFYNKGAFFTSANSESLEDLKKLQEKGVRILTCGACVDFYGLALSVGEISNMYEIVEKFMEADKIIQP